MDEMPIERVDEDKCLQPACSEMPGEGQRGEDRWREREREERAKRVEKMRNVEEEMVEGCGKATGS